jgi:uncharacterized membrane protein
MNFEALVLFQAVLNVALAVMILVQMVQVSRLQWLIRALQKLLQEFAAHD